MEHQQQLSTQEVLAGLVERSRFITASGEWVNDRTHGQQFKARFLKTSAPTSLEGIEKYLASGMIRGIGPVYAKKLVRAFGEKVFDTIQAEPERRVKLRWHGSPFVYAPGMGATAIRFPPRGVLS